MIGMTQEDKELLLKDLCARLPYNLYVRVEEFNVPKNEAITEGFVGNYLKDNRCNDYDADDILNEFADGCIDIKPYLRPMSSMTEEEKKEYQSLQDTACSYHYEFGDIVDDFLYFDNDVSLDYLNSIHIDYRGLIEKGLALEAPKDMYKLVM